MQYWTVRFAGCRNTTRDIIAYIKQISKIKIVILQNYFLKKILFLLLIPKFAQKRRKRCKFVYPPYAFPVWRIECGVRRRGISVICKDHNSAVIGATDNTSGSLKHTIHSGIRVSVIVAVLKLVFIVIAYQISFKRQAGKTHPGNYCSDKPASRQIYAFGKATAKHTEAYSAYARVLTEK